MPTPQEVKAMNAKLMRGQPHWNVYDFDCPGCGRHFPPGHTRLKLHGARWYHDQCATNLNGNRADRITVEHTAELDTKNCHTCGQPLKGRRIQINKWGYHVHYRCPKKKRPTP